MNTSFQHIEDTRRAQQTKRANGNYGRFFAMIATSMVTMFFVMYLNSYKIFAHAWFSETRLFMTFLMGATMMVIMLAFMLNMYKNKKANMAIFLSAFLIFATALWLVRSQVTVSDIDWMEGMIPHHSIAILTSKQAQIADPRVRQLADEIIQAQQKEISEMEWLIADIRKNGVANTPEAATARPVPKFSAPSE